MKIRIISNKGGKIKRLKPTDGRVQARGEEKEVEKCLNLREARGKEGRVLNMPSNKTINHRRESCKFSKVKFIVHTNI